MKTIFVNFVIDDDDIFNPLSISETAEGEISLELQQGFKIDNDSWVFSFSVHTENYIGNAENLPFDKVMSLNKTAGNYLLEYYPREELEKIIKVLNNE